MIVVTSGFDAQKIVVSYDVGPKVDYVLVVKCEVDALCHAYAFCTFIVLLLLPRERLRALADCRFRHYERTSGGFRLLQNISEAACLHPGQSFVANRATDDRCRKIRIRRAGKP